jgi:acetylornithine deacetylase/succinyl-diaminopimelate desuccinylase-like protein
MDKKSFEKHVEKLWTSSALPYLMDFIRIPNLSPAFDYNWNTNGLLDKTADFVMSYIKSLDIKKAKIDLIKDKEYTPLIFIDIEPSRQGDSRTVLFYAHFDKQPHGVGWDENKGPTKPVIENNHLYGRGTADDGYAIFSILTIIKVCQDLNCPLPRICVIFEGAEESTNDHLSHYCDKLIPIIGNNLIAFLPLDAACSDYDRLWLTNSLRGILDYELNIESLDKDCNYGPEASGRVAENCFLVRKVLDGIMDTTTGEIKISEFHVKEIPKFIEEQMKKEIEVIGDKYFDVVPLYPGVSPVKTDVKEAMINNRWKPTCSILGIDNCPKFEDNGFIVKKSIKAKLSMRLPPGIKENESMNALNKNINENMYFGAKFSIENIDYNEGWRMNLLSERTEKILNEGSKEFFGNEMVYKGDGRSIPFITYFQSKYPDIEVICTGICGVDSVEHGPNENVNLDACKKLILVLCHFLINI